MTIPAWARWTALAVLGILIAAAVSVAASRLTSQKIGLASEPLSAGQGLAPAKAGPASAPDRGTHGGQRPGHQASDPPPPTTTGATTTAVAPVPPPVPAPDGDGDDD